MRIGITCYPTYGGSGVVATELGVELARRGHEIHFISYALPFRLQQFDQHVFFHEVEVLAYPLFDHPPYTIALAAKMADVARQVGLDILHVHYAIPHAVSAHLATEVLGPGGPAVVTTLHGTDITLVGRDPSLFSITRFAIESSDGVTCVSRYLAERTRELFGITRPAAVIPNFVDTKRFAPQADGCPRAVFAPRGERLLIHLSNFRPLKRIPDVIRIFAEVRRHLPARLLMVGDGVERPAAVALAHELGVADDVLFLSRQEDVPRLLLAGDLFLLPSEEESFGLAALEAQSCGLPVIASRVGGLPEVIADGESGFLFPVGDVRGMAEAAVRLLQDPARHRQMGEAARRRVLAHFDAGLIVPQYEAFYAAVLAGRRDEQGTGRRAEP
ncbi:MAG: N-acetyl-alpha-D-glucosaminyl L-malate synthase BshA [candidate division NC10 bacterium]|nr:N-acetyl-alpha-D-glucosaminyl L-malate synthase BshA [candidate division NC10 bacterium]MBI3002223.1 N-acetyl-alpha-D-glucosaminyl L-malate synthase BshA [candidate division NC10 bacterium]MBI4391094.1 N-acetyl-alpha-D-glucosaminyl L-malate synthase BshA [candidate division NC10 bacterium]